ADRRHQTGVRVLRQGPRHRPLDRAVAAGAWLRRALHRRRHQCLEGSRQGRATQGRRIVKWVTRERPKIDRIACPWLIARFIDEAPEFLYVPADQVLKVAAETGAVPYDIPGVEMTHDGELCSFDAFLKKHRLQDP